MRIYPNHHKSLVQKVDRILTGEYSMKVDAMDVNSELMGTTKVPPISKTNGFDIEINYGLFINSDSFVPLCGNSMMALAALQGANDHGLAHNVLTPRLKWILHDEFKRRGPLFQQAFNIAEDWRVETQFVDMKRVAGPAFAALLNHFDKKDMDDLVRYVLYVGRLYLSDTEIFGQEMIDHLRTLRALAISHPVWDNHTIGMLWLQETNGKSGEWMQNEYMRNLLLNEVNPDFMHLRGAAWADAVQEVALAYYDKRWAKGHETDKMLSVRKMMDMIERLMFLLGPSDARDNGTNPCLDPWQDITLQFDQGEPDSDDSGGGGGGSGGTPMPSNGSEEDGEGGGGDGRGDRYSDIGNGTGTEGKDNGCRCGTCGR